jgi:hypothetical protein
MSDVTCPYCEAEQEINHDDGYGYEEGEKHEQECFTCEREVNFTTSISFNYDVFCKDGDHVMEPFGDKWPLMYECENCNFFERRKDETNERAT